MIEAVLRWVAQHAPECAPPILEVGSYNVNGSVRPFFGEPYIGIDMRPGPGVDEVVNITKDCQRFPDDYFNTIVSTETLEHVDNPWFAMERMYRLLASQGIMLITVPFMWPIHDYPDDYWRMTSSGLTKLFAEVGMKPIEVFTSDTHTYGMARK